MKSAEPISYTDEQVTCQCGNTFATRSALGKALKIEVCSNCHPFYTGKQKGVENRPRVQQFQQKYGR